RLELERVQKQRQQKCEDVIKEFQQKNKSEKAKVEEIKIRFMDDVLMFILSIMPGYESLTSVFPADIIREPLRMLDKYELGWRAPTEMARARFLWDEQRPCILEHKKQVEEKERKQRDEIRLEKEEQERIINLEKERKRKESLQTLFVSGTKAGERKTVDINNVEFAFRWCPAGKFMMGSIPAQQHSVILTQGFWMMETEVTQKQWKAIMDSNPSCFKGDDLPVEQVSWNDCQEFCQKCSQMSFPVELPTEAQWEYACRAGSTTEYFWGNTLNGDKANCNGTEPYGTNIKGKFIGRTTPVGSYEPNSWGLYDMLGNVQEWCKDWYMEYPSVGFIELFFGQFIKCVKDPEGPSFGYYRVHRGGGWNNIASFCRSAYRCFNRPDRREINLGFRCIISNIDSDS
ncbi:MAG: SUMF1/EgtB/PvdO family nonheme iron enzyme, partial [Thermoguttaceae bacterium]|nr:SUMF1/EgtB/PvdO family nonheme iron enzyme [Thermoguttaceae bacterium]